MLKNDKLRLDKSELNTTVDSANGTPLKRELLGLKELFLYKNCWFIK